MSKRRRSKGSKQGTPSPRGKKTKSKGGNPPKILTDALNRQQRTEDAVPSTSQAGFYDVLPEEHGSAFTGVTQENQSDMGDFGEIPEDIRPTNQQSTTAKLPPIVVKNVPLEKLKKDLESNGVQAQFKLTGIGIKVMVQSRSELDRTKAYLKQLKAEYFSHDIQEEKPFKAVVRGLPLMAKECIISELVHRYKLQPVACHVITRSQNQHESRDCLYLIHFRRGSITMNALKAVRSISSIIVSWEAYRGTHRDVTQCMRCLNFGHGTRNCNLKPRCNFCAGKHATSDCLRGETTTFKCANCGEAHKASDRSCSKREDYKRIRKSAAMRNLPGRRAPQDRQPFVPAEFPELQRAEGTSQHQRPPNPPAWQRNRNSNDVVITHQHSGPQVSHDSQVPETEGSSSQADPYPPEELVKIFLEMSDKLKQCRTRHDQIQTLGVFLIQYGR